VKLYRVIDGGLGWLFYLAETEDSLFAMLEEESMFAPELGDKREDWRIVEYPLDEEYRLPAPHLPEPEDTPT
jgi:hypothetical protein